MSKTKIVVALTLVVLMTVALCPGFALAAAPNQPTNVSPADTTTEISLTPLLTASAFLDSDGDETQYACQWQVRRSAGDYSAPVLDSGVYLAIASAGKLQTYQIAEGYLSDNSTYYWHVRYQDDTGWWSSWSTETSFTTIAAAVPTQPRNLSPINGAIHIGLTPDLQSSAFSTLNGVGTHSASQWQIRTVSGAYSDPFFDSGITSGQLTRFNVPDGWLWDGSTYYWHVRHQDKYGRWSPWSDETCFTTIPAYAPAQPINLLPDDGATGINLSPILASTDFYDLDTSDYHLASQWQISLHSGDFSDPVYDSGVSLSLASFTVPTGVLEYNVTYYWHVRHLDSYFHWSPWSSETSFTTMSVEDGPDTPSNISPLDGSTGIGLTPTLQSSGFVGRNAGDAHAASQWQIRSASGSYSGPLYDTGIDASSRTQFTIPSGLLNFDTVYYWHVRYQDNYGMWSAWSTETSFRTMANLPASQPVNVEPVGGAGDVGLTPTLTSSTFFDSDGDTHVASHWQITITADNYSDTARIWDSGTDAVNLTTVTVPSGTLSGNTTYHWHVRYKDGRGGWSAWSDETSFTTAVQSPPAPPVADFSASARVVTAGTDVVIFTDLSTGDNLVAWEWDFGDESDNVTWTVLSRPRDGKISYTYAEPGTYNVSLKVTAGSGSSDPETKANYITVNAVPEALFVAALDGGVVKFRDASTPSDGITTWKWNFGDGATLQWDATARQAADGEVSHAYKDAGTYVVSLTVTGPLGSHTFNRSVDVAGATGFEFTWWVILAIVGGLAVVGGAAFLVSRRMAR